MLRIFPGVERIIMIRFLYPEYHSLLPTSPTGEWEG
nr:MAG TPA: hypothetical protein [Caudoviricetes sp.]